LGHLSAGSTNYTKAANKHYIDILRLSIHDKVSVTTFTSEFGWVWKKLQQFKGVTKLSLQPVQQVPHHSEWWTGGFTCCNSLIFNIPDILAPQNHIRMQSLMFCRLFSAATCFMVISLQLLCPKMCLMPMMVCALNNYTCQQSFQASLAL
jgi:hypothetical protein